MSKKLGLFVVSIWLIIFCQNAKGQYYYEGRPAEPSFPVTSLRIKGIGDDFLSIITDMESDVLINPSMLPLLKSSAVSLLYLPYRFSYYMNTNAVASSFLFPKTFIPKLSFGFHNQLVYSSSGYNNRYGYGPGYNSFYYGQSHFTSYQQLIFLAFALSPRFRIAPFWTFAKIPYKEESGEHYEHYEVNNNDTTYRYYYDSNNNTDDEFDYHQLGLSTSFDFGINSFEVVGSWKNGKNDINHYSVEERYRLYAHSYSWIYDSSYYYTFELIRYLERDSSRITQLNNLDEMKGLVRWQKHINEHRKLNSFLDINKSSFELSGKELDSSSSMYYDSSFIRQRDYPSPESIISNVYNTYSIHRKAVTLSGKGEAYLFQFGVGYESPLTENLKGFIGIKSLFGTERDSILRQGLEIINAVTFPTIIIPKQDFDTICDTNNILTYEKTHRTGLNIFLPLGLEYNVLPSLTIRGGITAKFSYEKSGLKDQWKEFPEVVNKGIDFYYSFGMGLKLGKRFSLDGYNAGNIFTVRDWIAQIRYTF